MLVPPVIGPIPTTWEGEIADFKHWIDLRLAWLDANIPGNCWTTSVSAPATEHPIIFPNPASDYCFIEWPNHLISSLPVLFNINGDRVVIPSQINSGTVKLILDDIPQGFYLVKLTDNVGEIQWLKISVIK